MTSAKGIYLLQPDKGDGLGNFKAREIGFPWIDGGAIRRDWAALDTGTGAMVLNTAQVKAWCDRATQLNKRFTVYIECQVAPKWVMGSVDEKYVVKDKHLPGGSGIAVVPWEPRQLRAWGDFLHALSDIVVGPSVTFGEFGLLAGLRLNVPGRKHIFRDIEEDWAALKAAGYTRIKYLDAVMDALNSARSYFPDVPIWFGSFSTKDGDGKLTQYGLDAIASQFSDRFGPFVELWGAGEFRPAGDNLALMKHAMSKGMIPYFQALGSFIKHSPGNWEPGSTRWIGDGFQYVKDQFGGKGGYFECYPDDISPASKRVSEWPSICGSVKNYQINLQQWHDEIMTW